MLIFTLDKNKRDMCLYISTKFHHSVNGEYRAKKVGRKPLLVWKLLEYNVDILGYSTPYQYLPINFTNGMKVVDGVGFSPVRKKSYSDINTAVNEGVHAYRTKDKAIDATIEALASGWRFKRFPAIIPSGEKYFIGIYGDIVASKMIIFKSMKSLNKYLNGKETKTIDD